MKITKFEDIQAWQAARDTLAYVAQVTARQCFAEAPKLKAQMIDSAESAMSNIAEGYDSGSDPEFARFLRIARRSATEVKSHFYACLDRGFITRAEFEEAAELIERTKGLIGGFVRYLTSCVRERRRQAKEKGQTGGSRRPGAGPAGESRPEADGAWEA